VAFPYTDMTVPCENNTVRTLSNNRQIDDFRADSNSPITSAVQAAGTNIAAQQQQENDRQHSASRDQDKEDDKPAVVASPVPSVGGPVGNNVTISASWSSNTDYDAHLSGPIPSSSSRFHLYFGAPNAVPYASLDQDVIGTTGTETVTITPNPSGGQFVPGEYRYWIHDFSGTGFSSASPVSVTVRQGSHSLASLSVGQTTALNIWYVFNLQIDASGNVQVTTLNQFQSGSSSTVLCANVPGDECGSPPTKK
jgi:hypothetical protein